jgi:hypothetical protein
MEFHNCHLHFTVFASFSCVGFTVQIALYLDQAIQNMRPASLVFVAFTLFMLENAVQLAVQDNFFILNKNTVRDGAWGGVVVKALRY